MSDARLDWDDESLARLQAKRDAVRSLFARTQPRTPEDWQTMRRFSWYVTHPAIEWQPSEVRDAVALQALLKIPGDLDPDGEGEYYKRFRRIYDAEGAHAEKARIRAMRELIIALATASPERVPMEDDATEVELYPEAKTLWQLWSPFVRIGYSENGVCMDYWEDLEVEAHKAVNDAGGLALIRLIAAKHGCPEALVKRSHTRQPTNEDFPLPGFVITACPSIGDPA